jgi:integrase
VIPLTKESQKILKPRLRGRNPDEYVFKPAEATKIINKKIRDKYDHNSFCRAVKRGCKRAKVDVFVPYDLRRTTATGARSILGKEAAKLLLGHTKTDTTDIYLLDEVQEAIKVAKLLAVSM